MVVLIVGGHGCEELINETKEGFFDLIEYSLINLRAKIQVLKPYNKHFLLIKRLDS